MTVASLRAARVAFYKARDKLAAEIEATHPVDSAVSWQRGRNDAWQSGVVVAHGWTGLRVKNNRTEKIYWIDVFDIYGGVQ